MGTARSVAARRVRARRAQIAEGRARAASPRRSMVDGEEREGGALRRRAGADRRARPRRRSAMRHRARPAGAAPPSRSRANRARVRTRALRLPPRRRRRRPSRGAARAAERRGTRAPTSATRMPALGEEARARDGERRLARTAEGGAADAERGHARGERSRDARANGPSPREERCGKAGVRRAALESLLNRETQAVHAEHAIMRIRPMSHFVLDPRDLAHAQLARDHERTMRTRGWIGSAWLFAHKVDRMSPSPLAFLRGAAPLFYDILERVPVLADGPPGRGLHRRRSPHRELRRVPAGPGAPQERGGQRRSSTSTTSTIAPSVRGGSISCGSRRASSSRGASSVRTVARRIALAEAMLEAYERKLDSGSRRLPPPPRTVRRLLAQASERDRSALLDGPHRARRWLPSLRAGSALRRAVADARARCRARVRRVRRGARPEEAPRPLRDRAISPSASPGRAASGACASRSWCGARASATESGSST